MEYNNKQTSNPLTFGLSLAAGIGIVLMILAGGIGVTRAVDADPTLLALLFWGGLIVMLTAIIAWFAVVQPHKHFDDIDQPKDTGHGHGHAAHDAHDAHAIVPAGEHSLDQPGGEIHATEPVAKH